MRNADYHWKRQVEVLWGAYRRYFLQQGRALVLFCWSDDTLKCEKYITNIVDSDRVVVLLTYTQTEEGCQH